MAASGCRERGWRGPAIARRGWCGQRWGGRRRYIMWIQGWDVRAERVSRREWSSATRSGGISSCLAVKAATLFAGAAFRGSGQTVVGRGRFGRSDAVLTVEGFGTTRAGAWGSGVRKCSGKSGGVGNGCFVTGLSRAD